MYKVFLKGNYLIVVNTATNEEMEGLASNVMIHRKLDNSTSWMFHNLNGINDGIEISETDIQDENGDTYSDFDLWRAENTGSSVSILTLATSDLQTISNNILAEISGKLPSSLSASGALSIEQLPQSEYVYSQAGVIAINTDLLIIDCAGLSSVSIQCISMGTGGVVTPAWSNNGTTFPTSATITTSSGSSPSTITAAGIWTTQIYGRYLRLRLTTATTAGTTTFSVQGLYSANNLPTPGQVISLPTGASTSALQTTGNTSLSSIDGKLPTALGSFGGLKVETQGNSYKKYIASIRNLNFAASATAILEIIGSSTKKIKIIEIEGWVSSTGAAIAIDISIIKQSTPCTGGTSTTLTPVAFDSAFPASTATVKAYTVNPTLGTSVGNIAINNILVTQPTSTTINPVAIEEEYDIDYAPTLNNASESIVISFNGNAIAATRSADFYIEYVEY